MKNPLANVFPQKLRRHTPTSLQTFRDIESEMERWMRQDPFTLDWPLEMNGLDFSPSCNIAESDKEYVLEFDIPGIKKDDVNIEIENNRISVSGQRQEKKEEKDKRHYLSESYYGSFARSFNLPSAVNEDKVDAHYEDGVLTIKVPKLETAKTKKVKVQ